jgi:hypothetical protein
VNLQDGGVICDHVLWYNLIIPRAIAFIYLTLKPAREKSFPTDFPKSLNPVMAAGIRAINTISQPGSTGFCRVISRRSLFIRFLTTAFPIRRLTTNPNLVKWSLLGKALRTNSLSVQDLPSAYIILNCNLLFKKLSSFTAEPPAHLNAISSG